MPETWLHFQHSGQRGSIQRQRTALIALRHRYVINTSNQRGRMSHTLFLSAPSYSELAVAQREAVQLLVASGYAIL